MHRSKAELNSRLGTETGTWTFLVLVLVLGHNVVNNYFINYLVSRGCSYRFGRLIGRIQCKDWCWLPFCIQKSFRSLIILTFHLKAVHEWRYIFRSEKIVFFLIASKEHVKGTYFSLRIRETRP